MSLIHAGGRLPAHADYFLDQHPLDGTASKVRAAITLVGGTLEFPPHRV